MGLGLWVFNVTFNNISVILWQSILLVEETEYHWPAASYWQTLSHKVVLSTLHHEWDLNSQLQWWQDTYCTCSCKSNYHMITTTTASFESMVFALSYEQLTKRESFLFPLKIPIATFTSTNLSYNLSNYYLMLWRKTFSYILIIWSEWAIVFNLIFFCI